MRDPAEIYLGVSRTEIAPYLADPWIEEWPEERIRKALVYYRHEERMRERHHGELSQAKIQEFVSGFAHALSLGIMSVDTVFHRERGPRPEVPWGPEEESE